MRLHQGSPQQGQGCKITAIGGWLEAATGGIHLRERASERNGGRLADNHEPSSHKPFSTGLRGCRAPPPPTGCTPAIKSTSAAPRSNPKQCNRDGSSRDVRTVLRSGLQARDRGVKRHVGQPRSRRPWRVSCATFPEISGWVQRRRRHVDNRGGGGGRGVAARVAGGVSCARECRTRDTVRKDTSFAIRWWLIVGCSASCPHSCRSHQRTPLDPREAGVEKKNFALRSRTAAARRPTTVDARKRVDPSSPR